MDDDFDDLHAKQSRPDGCDNGRLPCVCDGTGAEWGQDYCTACKGRGWLVCECAR